MGRKYNQIKLLMHQGHMKLYMVLQTTQSFKKKISLVSECSLNVVKPIIWGQNIVHAAADHSMTQVSHIFWVILKRLKTSNIII